MTDFQKLFDLQKKFQERLENDISSQAFRTEQTLAAIVELVEFLRETPWRSWKKTAVLMEKEAREELIDLWHFVINLSLSMGMSAEDIYSEFLKKHEINNKRQDGGY